MKKSLLLTLALSIALFAGAQKAGKPSLYKAQVKPVGMEYIDQNAEATFSGLFNPKSLVSRDITKLEIASSINIFGILNTDQSIIRTDPANNMVLFGTRAGGPFGATGNDLGFAYSTDRGETFSHFIISGNGKFLRYPSIELYNPEGNTDPANMYAVFVGPVTNGSNWVENFYGSVKLDGTSDLDFNTFPYANSSTYQNILNIKLTATSDGKFHVASRRLDGTSTAPIYAGIEVMNGVWNPTTNKVDWDTDLVNVNFELAENNRLDAVSMVFTQDGSLGYLVGTGIDPEYNEYGVEWPVVFKTVDGGLTWDKVPGFDYSTIEVFQEYLYGTASDPDLVIPRWYNKWIPTSTSVSIENAYTIDHNGNLHIAGPLVSTSSIHPDSLNYFYNDPYMLFDVFMQGDGSWNAVYVDTIRTDAADESLGFGVGWDHRLAFSTSEDATKLFLTWADTDPKFYGGGVTMNSQPDIFTWGFDVANNMMTLPVNETALGDFWGENFWMHVGDLIFQDGDQYTIPLTTSRPQLEQGTGDDVIMHSYTNGIIVVENDFTIVDVETIPAISSFNLDQNYPNPFAGNSQIKVTLSKSANVTVEIFNMMGRKVAEIANQQYNAGSHIINIDANNLTSGMYIYTVTANGERMSRKMTVK
jgi:hypothetical protein